MPLEIKIKVSISNTKCNALNIYEQTGVYADPGNLGGWGETENISTNNIELATLSIYDYLDTTLLKTVILKNDSINLYLQSPNSPYPVQFLIVSNTSWDQPDGIFLIKYELIDTDNVTYKNKKQYSLFLCNLCNCINSLKTKIIKECDSKKLESLKLKIDQLEIIKYGIESAFSCKDFTTALSLLSSAKKICDTVASCGCGC